MAQKKKRLSLQKHPTLHEVHDSDHPLFKGFFVWLKAAATIDEITIKKA